MTLFKILLCISTCVFVGYASFAEDPSHNLAKEKNSAREMTKAMQRAQLLLSDVSAIFKCDYSGYDVNPRTTNNETTYLVVVDVQDDGCGAMVAALNEQGAKDNLHFVSENKLPEMSPLPDSGPAPYDEFNNPQMDYRLIHEVDPAEDQ